MGDATDDARPAEAPAGTAEQRPSRLTVLAGPTAVGKGTVSADVRERYPQVWLSVSATTRSPRPGEVDGVHYHFVDDARFDEMTADGDLLEWAVVHGRHRYGTPRAPVERALAEGRAALLEIDLQGARQVRATMPTARFVFLAPPSWEELVRRLVGRGTEDEAERRRRLATARVELAAEAEFDVTVVNADVLQAGDDLVSSMGLTPLGGDRSTSPGR
ncbi:guanylate kinase [Pseudokineococcus sp. 1T1Z-3]|uniref:guanylate kinase n=1 Tax=Pseudokineococcus sp. 1T1Z-3 TaxID=3132745 RepID=UPI0030A0541D